VWREVTRLPSGELSLYVLDVGQGDALLMETPSGKQILVDGGPDLSTLEHLGKLLPFFDRSIDLLVLTHPHEDHIASFPALLARYDISNVLLAGTASTGGRYAWMLDEIAKQNISVLVADAKKDLDLGDGIVLDVLWPGVEELAKREWDTNDTSVAVRVLGASKRILLTGDIEEGAENAILKRGIDLKAEVLKVAHHGSRTSSTEGFLSAAGPEVALISAGRENKFGHPHSEIMDRFTATQIPVRLTAEEGTISLKIP
jgi:competence protein ComEC